MNVATELSRTRIAWVIAIAVTSLAVIRPATGESHFTESHDGLRLHYDAYGSGIPIVFIAGGPGSSADTLKFTHRLLHASGQLVFLDNRGRGKSQAPSDKATYTLENDVKDVEAVRRHLKAEQIIVYGHSYGSMVALSYAIEHPDQTLAVITTGGIHGAGVWQSRNIDIVKIILQQQYPNMWAQIESWHKAGRLTGDPAVQKLLAGIDFYHHIPESPWRFFPQFPDPGERKNFYNVEVYLAMAGPDPEWTIGGTIADVELLPELSTYTGPALIMGGRHDIVSPVLNQVEIAEALPGGRLVIFENSAHLPFEEEPLRFLSVVSDFIAEVQPGS